MNKRPEKKTDFVESAHESLEFMANEWNYGYNQALDDMDKYLPDFNEIISLLPPQDVTPSLDMGVYAKSIHKRIRE